MRFRISYTPKWWLSWATMLLAGMGMGYLFGPVIALVAAMIGAAIGSYFDPSSRAFRENKNGQRMQQHFSSGVEAMTGYVLAEFELPPSDYERITGGITAKLEHYFGRFWFVAGRENSFSFARSIRRFDQYCMPQVSLVRTLCGVLSEALVWARANADNLAYYERAHLRLQHIQDALDIPNAYFDEIERQRPRNQEQLPLNTSRAAKLLGVGANAGKAEVKLAYKRKVRDIHPDRLIAKGASEQALRVATQEMAALRKAYEFMLARS